MDEFWNQSILFVRETNLSSGELALMLRDYFYEDAKGEVLSGSACDLDPTPFINFVSTVRNLTHA